MKKPNPGLALGLVAAGILALASCGRDPIFFTISLETPPQLPLVRGIPTQMVLFDWELGPEPLAETMDEPPPENGAGTYPGNGAEPGPDPVSNARPVVFVASGDLYWYAPRYYTEDSLGNRVWDNTSARWGVDIGISQPHGRIIDIAATREHLYVLSMSGVGGRDTTSILRLDNSTGGWIQIPRPEGSNLQAIFADPQSGRLFASTLAAIFHLNDQDELAPLVILGRSAYNTAGNQVPVPGTGLLSGVVYRGGGVHILSTRSGILEVTGNDGAWIGAAGDTGDVVRVFMGMIRLPDNATVIAAERTGFLYQVTPGAIARIPNQARDPDDSSLIGGDYVNIGRDASGALALWEERDADGVLTLDKRMLIAGAQGPRHTTHFNNGYVEFTLTPGGSLDTAIPRRATGTLISVDNNDRYRTSLGRLPINHLFQAPWEIDENMTFFASTQTDGLWSYRVRAGIPQWNTVSPEDYN